MSDSFALSRSPELMSRNDSALLVVDMQVKLLKAIGDQKTVIWNVRRLVDGAAVLGVPVFATEQYPAGLGPTTGELAGKLTGQLGEIPEKLAFSCRTCGDLFAQFEARGRYKILVVGIETHVCVQQTVLDLLAAGFRPFIAVDAIGSRFQIDRDTAFGRMESQGATLTTAEAALFEWCEVAGTPEFKAISAIVRELSPTGHTAPGRE